MEKHCERLGSTVLSKQKGKNIGKRQNSDRERQENYVGSLHMHVVTEKADYCD